MIKKVLKVFAVVLIVFTVFSFYMSPRLGGLLNFGKESIDPEVFQLAFDTVAVKKYDLVYKGVSDNEDLKTLRQEFKLDSLVKDCNTDFERLTKIQSWVQSRWQHDGENVPEKNDALFILREAEKGKQFRCVEYSIVASQCLQSLGFIVRGLGLMAKDINSVKSGGGHVVNEVYLRDLNKWVFIDPQWDVITTYNELCLKPNKKSACLIGCVLCGYCESLFN